MDPFKIWVRTLTDKNQENNSNNHVNWNLLPSAKKKNKISVSLSFLYAILWIRFISCRAVTKKRGLGFGLDLLM